MSGDAEATRLAGLVHQCTLCGLDLQTKLDRFPAINDVELRLRVAVGAGRARAALVGGVDGRWETVLQGEALDQLRDTLHVARAGEVVLSQTAGDLLGPRCKAERRGAHFVVGSAGPVASTQSAPVERSTDVEESTVRSFVPSSSVLARVDAGLHAWLAEFRDVTVVFVHLQIGNLAPGDHAMLQHAIRLVQTVVARFEVRRSSRL